MSIQEVFLVQGCVPVPMMLIKNMRKNMVKHLHMSDISCIFAIQLNDNIFAHFYVPFISFSFIRFIFVLL